MQSNSVEFNETLIKRYDKTGPRYTSYPTAVQFNESFSVLEYNNAARSADQKKPLSLYFHIPFCSKVCFFCGCNKVVTKFRDRAAPYLNRLHREIELQAELFGNTRPVDQLHWGGGTPTFISHDEMKELMEVTRRHFHLHDDDSGEYSIEIDPREINPETLQVLRSIGFNRISLGVQDFDSKVQQAVNRIQPVEQTSTAINEARRLGFNSISVDLIYGLPFQNVKTFNKTLDTIIELNPDRLSVFNYAHLPEMFKPQRRINAEDLPEPAVKLEILRQAIEKLTAAGYVYIGMDHFAKPEDELTRAQQRGELQRNFQGYSTSGGCDLLAFGVSAISALDDVYVQNAKDIATYTELLEQGRKPIVKGYRLSHDDRIRRAVINQLICHFVLDFATINKEFGISFKDYFDDELMQLQTMANDGLLTIDAKGIRVHATGRLLIRHICMAFDAYLSQPKATVQYSRII